MLATWDYGISPQGTILDGFVADGKEEFDSRDIKRVQDSNEYVGKFVRQVSGDENKAYNMLVCQCGVLCCVM